MHSIPSLGTDYKYNASKKFQTLKTEIPSFIRPCFKFLIIWTAGQWRG